MSISNSPTDVKSILPCELDRLSQVEARLSGLEQGLAYVAVILSELQGRLAQAEQQADSASKLSLLLMPPTGGVQ